MSGPAGAIFQDLPLTLIAPTLPVGVDNPTNPTHVVRLALSTGETVVFGTVSALLKVMTIMREKGQHMINPTEDTFIALAGSTKMVIGEMTFQNQKLLNAGSFTYCQGKLEVRMRAGSCVETLDGALQCVGHYRMAASPYQSTADLLTPTGGNSPRLIVVDYRYSETDGGTTFEDTPPLQEQVPAGILPG